ncbi:MAG: Beta-glucosidase [Nocardioidaceae bacterium]|nr:Beta-glucosidase [Nocardioidaceae bacterium]
MASSDFPILPPGFRFGTSTASYQIEGAVDVDGRGPSIWDTFTAEPGRILDGSSGEVACDHYHRVAEDVALMQSLGTSDYRFSVAWPRIQPDGSGPANPKGLAFYDRLVDTLLDAGITPMATLYHWDLPQALEDKGGWLARDTAERFGEYAAIVADRLGDRVAHWAPVNEPNVVTMEGYALGTHAPGRTLAFDALPTAHHLLLGHGLAVQALRAAGATSVGTATNHIPVRAASDSDTDRGAAQLFDLLWNRLFADPILLGAYPEGFADLMPGPVADDLALVAAPLDFYGFNYYNPLWVRERTGVTDADAPPDQPEVPEGIPFEFAPATGYPLTDFGWPVAPDGLVEVIGQLQERYPDLPPLVVTEQGCSYATGPDAAGAVPDTDRIAYYDQHLRALAGAIADGADVRGYYAWSLLDNFEWAMGYTQRFGLVWVDYETQQRIPKASYAWYAAMIAANSAAT